MSPTPPPTADTGKSDVSSWLPTWFCDHIDARRTAGETSLRHAEQVVLALRRKLRATDPSLPPEYDGKAWQPIEAEFIA